MYSSEVVQRKLNQKVPDEARAKLFREERELLKILLKVIVIENSHM